jgi:hypothetical protein
VDISFAKRKQFSRILPKSRLTISLTYRCLAKHLARDNLCPYDRSVVYYTPVTLIWSFLNDIPAMYRKLYATTDWLSATYLASIDPREVLYVQAAFGLAWRFRSHDFALLWIHVPYRVLRITPFLALSSFNEVRSALEAIRSAFMATRLQTRALAAVEVVLLCGAWVGARSVPVSFAGPQKRVLCGVGMEAFTVVCLALYAYILIKWIAMWVRRWRRRMEVGSE